MGPNEVLSHVSTLGARIEVVGDKLRLYHPELVPPDIKAALIQYKPAIIERLIGTSLEALPHECPCLWNEPRTLDAPCQRCSFKGLCPKCGRCRTCWQHRVLSRVKERPRG